jgi:hypothetical protein
MKKKDSAVYRAVKYIAKRYEMLPTDIIYQDLISDAYWSQLQYDQKKFEFDIKNKTAHATSYIVNDLLHTVRRELNRKTHKINPEWCYGWKPPDPFEIVYWKEKREEIDHYDDRLTASELKAKHQMLEGSESSEHHRKNMLRKLRDAVGVKTHRDYNLADRIQAYMELHPDWTWQEIYKKIPHNHNNIRGLRVAWYRRFVWNNRKKNKPPLAKT